MYADHIMSWLSTNYKPPFVVVGPDGCGKSMLLNYCFNKLHSTQVSHYFVILFEDFFENLCQQLIFKISTQIDKFSQFFFRNNIDSFYLGFNLNIVLTITK